MNLVLLCLIVSVCLANTVFVPYRASKYDGVSVVAGQAVPVEIREPLDVAYNFLVYNQNRNWTAAGNLFTYDADFEISGVSVYHGLPKIVGYLMILDPDVTDTNYNLNTTIYEAYYAKGCINPSDCRDRQQYVKGNNRVHNSGDHNHGNGPKDVTGTSLMIFNLNIQQHSIQTNQNFSFDALFEARVNSDMKIVYIRYVQDLLQLTPYFPGLVHPNATDLCHKIQSVCVGVNQQYASFEECYSYVSALPTSGFSSLGKSIQCVNWHYVLAARYPSGHCMHVGPHVVSPFVTPCQNWGF